MAGNEALVDDSRRRRVSARLVVWTAASLAAGAALPLQAQMPTGGVVIGGSASITPVNPSLLTIQQRSDRAVIDWTSFSIGAAKRVDFQQPTATSAVLNRVTGRARSVIDGALTGNGRVYILNPSGVLIGSTGRVDVHSFLGAAAGASDATATAWRDGASRIEIAGGEGSAEVRGGGAVTAADGGFIAFAGPAVRIDGLLYARVGRVRLGAGSAFAIDFAGDGLLSVSAGTTSVAHGALARDALLGVGSDGVLMVDGGTIALSALAAQDLVNTVIGVDGELWARNAATSGTAIQLTGGGGAVLVGGLLDADGPAGPGGNISVIGDSVTTSSAARMTARGATSGGTVSIEATAGGATVAGSISVAGATAAGGALNVRSSATAAVTGSVVSKGATAGGSVLVDGSSVDYRARYDGGTGTLDIVSSDALTVGTESAEGQSFVSSESVSQSLQLGTSTNVSSRGALSVTGTIDGRGEDISPHGELRLAAGGQLDVSSDISTLGRSIQLTSPLGVRMVPKADGGTPQLRVDGAPADVFVRSGSEGEASSSILQHVVTAGVLRVAHAGAGAVFFESPLGGQREPNLSAPLGGVDVAAPNARVRFGHSVRTDGALSVTGAEISLENDVFAANGVTLTGTTVLRGNIVTTGAKVRFGGDVTLDPDASHIDGAEILETFRYPVEGSVSRQDSAVTVVVPKRTISIDTTDASSESPRFVGADIAFDGDVDVAAAFRPEGQPDIRYCATMPSVCGEDTAAPGPAVELAGDPTVESAPRWRLGPAYPDIVALALAAGTGGDIVFLKGAGVRAGAVIDASTGQTLGVVRAQFGSRSRLRPFLRSTNTFELAVESARALYAEAPLWFNGVDMSSSGAPSMHIGFFNHIYNYAFTVQHGLAGVPQPAGLLAGGDATVQGGLTTSTYGAAPGAPDIVAGSIVTGPVPGQPSVVRPPSPEPAPSAPLESSAYYGALLDLRERDRSPVRQWARRSLVGGQGVAAEADLGRNPATSGAAHDVLHRKHHVLEAEYCQGKASERCLPLADPEYLQSDAYD